MIGAVGSEVVGSVGVVVGVVVVGSSTGGSDGGHVGALVAGSDAGSVVGGGSRLIVFGVPIVGSGSVEGGLQTVVEV